MNCPNRKPVSFGDLLAEKHRQQQADRAALIAGKLRPEDLSLFVGLDRSKIRIVSSPQDADVGP